MGAYFQDVFSGGLFDTPIDAPTTAAQRLENCALTSLGKPYQRPFVKPLFSTHQGWPSFAGIGTLFDRLFFVEQGNGNVYHQDTAGTQTLLTSTRNPFFNNVSSNFMSWTRTQGHLIMAAQKVSMSEPRSKPVKAYFDASSTPKAVTAGLPKPVLLSQSTPPYFSIIGNTYMGGVLRGVTAIPTPTPNVTFATVYLKIGDVIWRGGNPGFGSYTGVAIENFNSGGTDKFYWNTGLTDLQNFTAMALSMAADFSSDYTFFADPAGRGVLIFYHGEAFEEPPITISITQNSPNSYFTSQNAQSDTSFHSYLYYIVYSYDHYAQLVQGGSALLFTDYGPPAVYRVRTPSVNPIAPPGNNLDQDFQLSNGTYDAYETAGVFVEYYRTVDKGTEAYRVARYSNGVPPLATQDAVTDAELIFGLPFYGNGGVLYNDPPPRCFFVKVASQACYYGNITDVTSGEIEANVVVQSKVGDFDSVPAGNRLEFDAAVTGIGNAKEIPIVGTLTGVYRIQGQFDDLGLQSATPIQIASETGIVSHYSMVSTDAGCFFAGSDGFYFTDGYRCKRISDSFRQTYMRYFSVSTRPSFGSFDKVMNRIIWTFDMTETGGSNNRSGAFVLDLNFDYLNGQGWTGPWFSLDPTKTAAAQVQDYWGQTAVGDAGGLYMVTYPRGVNTGTTTGASRWLMVLSPWDVFTSGDFAGAGTSYNTVSVPCAVKTISTQFGEPRVRKWVNAVKTTHVTRREFFGKKSIPYLTLSSYTCGAQMATQVVSNNDNGRRISRLRSQFKTISERDDLDTYFSQEAVPSVGFYQGGLNEFRWRFPYGGLRCTYKQLEISSGQAVLFKSDVSGLGTLNQGAKTLHVASAPFAGSNAEYGFFLYLENDGYAQPYPITSSSTDTLVVGGSPPANGSYKWVVRGAPKNMLWSLNSFEIEFESFGRTQANLTTGEQGNAE